MLFRSTSVGTLSTLSVSGNANVGNIGANNGVFTSVSGSGAALTSLNASNITSGTIGASYVATLNQNTTGYAATVSASAQPNITSTGTLSSLSVSGTANIGNINLSNISVTGQIVSTLATGTAPFAVTSTTQVANLNVATAGVAGTVTAASQPNITSLGTLSSVSVSGNATVGNVVGAVANGN